VVGSLKAKGALAFDPVRNVVNTYVLRCPVE